MSWFSMRPEYDVISDGSSDKEKQLRRDGTIKVILKKLENIESTNRSWFDEAKSHSTLDSYNNNTNEFENLECDNLSQISRPNSSSKLHSLSSGKLHQLVNLPESKNAIEAFHSKPYDFNIPDDIDAINVNSLKGQDEPGFSVAIEDITKNLNGLKLDK
ncbi:hypothetical protein C1645_848352 [Glomus cerebriforme]|uniref:Uncharacterized protein n=1 Tax=Glomus cerebriforme TaxID=658196 RepID=A0A397SXY8_9GLOM|nr:hypothetical protein C1645_848352 [Glomus cerebriforme]